MVERAHQPVEFYQAVEKMPDLDGDAPLPGGGLAAAHLAEQKQVVSFDFHRRPVRHGGGQMKRKTASGQVRDTSGYGKPTLRREHDQGHGQIRRKPRFFAPLRPRCIVARFHDLLIG